MMINEIFYSIQGEGKWTGLPNIFIRTTGCNLRCSFCDTQYAYKNGREMSIEEIARRIKKYPCKYVCLTGGEPLLQKDTIDLIKKLIEENYSICLETNGSLNIEKILVNIKNRKHLIISLDIKCPSSNMHQKMYLNNISLLNKNDQLKFVILDKKDYEYAKNIIRKHKPQCTVFFQPVWGIDPIILSRWILSDGLNIRLSLQIHKIIWGDKKRGV
ncbi:MAG: hypothetical protein DRN05_01120 [Thermoplasmata archaeon]|nr:MAG: hypothetical protein DRN05_01120 [Thermoplasmata archaeon]